MTRPPIAFVASSKSERQAEYVQALARAMPEEQVLTFAELTSDERARVEVAVVTEPDPVELAALSRLVWIQSLWAGVERLVADLGGMAPTIVRLVDPEMARTMAESVLAWTYYLHRDMPTYARQQREGIWKQRIYREASQLRIGLLGLGVLGTAAADRLIGAGFEVAAWTRTPRKQAGAIQTYNGDVGLDDLLAVSDIVVCLLPLTNETRSLLDASRLGAMKPGAALINFARGPIVDTRDLVSALDSGQVSHAVLDVFEEEPLPSDSALWCHPCVTVLPHISGPTNLRTACAVVASNLRAYRESGRIPLHVDVGRGY